MSTDAASSCPFTQPAGFNPLLPAFREDPHPFFHRLREQDPVHWSPVFGVWVLTRYDDVKRALRDPRFSASSRTWTHHDRFFCRHAMGGTTLLAQTYGNWMLQMDPPDHTRLRALVSKAFTPRVVETMRPRIERMVADLLDQVEPGATMDVISQLAYPLPIMVIADLLGVPARDHDKIKDWSGELLPSFSPALSAKAAAQVHGALASFRDYFQRLAEARRQAPRDDLISGLIAAADGDDRLSEDELLATCILLAFAGHASTVQLIANAVHGLLEHPDQRDRLLRQPDLIGGAMTEALRHGSPLQLVYRTTLQPVEFGETIIPPNQMVFVSLAAANRDPTRFPDPDRFDITRDSRKHLAFGHHIHFCAGAPLARLEGEIAVLALLDRFPQARLDAAGVAREPSLLLRGIQRLPITLEQDA